jgi:tape measure domain-containing protein
MPPAAGSITGGIAGNGRGIMGMLGGLGGIKSMIATAGIGLALSGAVSAGSDFAGSAISKSLDRQQIQTSFNVLAGNRQSGEALTKQLVGLQKDTILGSEVFKNAQTMMGFGFDSKEVYSNLKMLGDVSMGDAGKLESLTLAFSQIRAAGRLTGQDLLQLINAGFNPLGVISEKTGKSIGQLKEEMEKGKIPFEMIQKAFRDATSEGGRFHNMLAQIAETPAGKVQQLAGEWDEFKISVGAALMPLVSMALDIAKKVLPIVENIVKPIQEGVSQISGIITGITGETGNWGYYVEQVKVLFEDYILPYVGQVWNTAIHIVGEMVKFVNKSELVKAIFDGIVTNFKVQFIILRIMMAQFKVFFDTVIMPALKIAETAYRFFTGKGKNKPAGGGYIDVPLPKGMTPDDFSGGDKPTSPTAPPYDPGKAARSVAGGGSRPTNITINLNKEMVGQITINPVTMSQGADQVKAILMEYLAQVLNSGNKLAME